MSDLYQLLGVSREASQDEIKRAYRKKARQLHPDVNPSPDAADEFKQVSHAFDVLSDEQSRQRYDLGGDDASFGGGAGFGGFGDIFEAFFGAANTSGGRGRPRSRRSPGEDSLLRLQLTLEDVMFGSTHVAEVSTAVLCDSCQGECTQPGTEIITCTICQGRGHMQRVVPGLLGNMITNVMCGSCQGYGTVIPHPCISCQGQGRVRAERQIDIEIPAGVDTGMRLKLRGEGEVGPGGGPAADLFVEIKVKSHPNFTRDGDDLLATLELSMTDAVLGANVKIAALDGPIDLEVRPGVQNGDVLTVKNRGISKLRSNNRGDLKVAVQVAIPSKLDNKQRQLFSDFAQSYRSAEPELLSTSTNAFQKFWERFKR